MALTFEQFKVLRSKGLTIEQIARFEGGEKPKKDLTQARTDLAQAKAESEKAGKFLSSPVAQIGSALGDVFLGGAARLAMTAKEAIPTIKSGGVTPQEKAKSPFAYREPIEGYLSKQQRTAEEVAQGKKPLLHSIAPMAQAVGDVVDVASAAKILTSAVKKGASLASPALSYFKNKPKVGLTEATSMVMEPLNKKGAISLLGKAGVKFEGLSRKIVPKASEYDIKIARTVQKFLDKDPLKSVANINNEIARVSNSEILPALQKYNQPLTTQKIQSLVKRIDDIEPESLITKSDKTLNNAVIAIKANVKKIITENAKDNAELYRTRQILDNMVEAETKGKAFEVSNAAHEAYLAIRKVINKFVAEGLPEGKGMFLDKLDYEHKLFTATRRIAMNNYKLIGSDIFKRSKFLQAVGKTAPWAGAGAAGYVASELSRFFRQ